MGKEIVVVENPKSPEAEMFRNLRTNIQFMNVCSEKKVMIVTSTVPGEGKSYISGNLAAAFAQLNKTKRCSSVDEHRYFIFCVF